DARIEMIPVAVDQAVEEIERIAKAGESFLVELGLGEPRRHLQILRLGRERFGGELVREVPIPRFALRLPLALRHIVVLTACLLDLVEQRLVAQLHSARIVTGDCSQELVTERHVSLGGNGVDDLGPRGNADPTAASSIIQSAVDEAGVISSSRTSKIGNSSP